MRHRPSSRSGVFLASLLTVSALAGCQPAERGRTTGPAVDTAAVAAAVDSLRQAYLEAYNAGELDRLASLYADDAVLLPPDAPPVRGRDSIRTHFAGELAPGPTLEISSGQLGPLGPEWTSLAGGYRVTVRREEAEEPTAVEGSYLILVRKTPNGWKVSRHAGTYDSMPPGPGEL